MYEVKKNQTISEASNRKNRFAAYGPNFLAVQGSKEQFMECIL